MDYGMCMKIQPFIVLPEQRFKIMNRYDHAFIHPNIELTGDKDITII